MATQRPLVAVVGDQMLDVYHLGSSSRVSPEAPVPVVKIAKVTSTPGGACNVAENLRGLGCETFQPWQSVFPVKNRLMVGDYQVARWDEDECGRNDLECTGFLRRLPQADALVIADYNKGALGLTDLKALAAALPPATPVFVDTKRNPQVFRDLFIPGREVWFFPNSGEYEKHQVVYDCHPNVIVKQSAMGAMDLYCGETCFSLPSEARWVKSVSGAGDSLLAGFVTELLRSNYARSALCYAMKVAACAVEGPMTTVVTSAMVEARDGR